MDKATRRRKKTIKRLLKRVNSESLIDLLSEDSSKNFTDEMYNDCLRELYYSNEEIQNLFFELRGNHYSITNRIIKNLEILNENDTQDKIRGFLFDNYTERSSSRYIANFYSRLVDIANDEIEVNSQDPLPIMTLYPVFSGVVQKWEKASLEILLDEEKFFTENIHSKPIGRIMMGEIPLPNSPLVKNGDYLGLIKSIINYDDIVNGNIVESDGQSAKHQMFLLRLLSYLHPPGELSDKLIPDEYWTEIHKNKSFSLVSYPIAEERGLDEHLDQLYADNVRRMYEAIDDEYSEEDFEDDVEIFFVHISNRDNLFGDFLDGVKRDYGEHAFDVIIDKFNSGEIKRPESVSFLPGGVAINLTSLEFTDGGYAVTYGVADGKFEEKELYLTEGKLYESDPEFNVVRTLTNDFARFVDESKKVLEKISTLDGMLTVEYYDR